LKFGFQGRARGACRYQFLEVDDVKITSAGIADRLRILKRASTTATVLRFP